jgi:uncharacterized protein
VSADLIPLSDENRAAAAHNAAIVSAALKPRLREWSNILNMLINGTMPIRTRLRRLYKVADEITAVAAPYSPCKRGCSACCHMATLVSLPEAEMMAESIGVKLTVPKSWPFYDQRSGSEFAARDEFAASFHESRKPCTFLVNNECSIYEHRPLACRVHLNLAANADPCQMDAPRETAMLDLMTLDMAYMMIGRSAKLHDIREYFPRPKETTIGKT